MFVSVVLSAQIQDLPYAGLFLEIAFMKQHICYKNKGRFFEKNGDLFCLFYLHVYLIC